jgi:tetratricopeptide (TPR) repeat protein
MKKIIFASVLLLINQVVYADSSDMDTVIKSLQKQWAVARYQTDEDKQDQAFTELSKKAEQAVTQFPGKAEPLIWNAIIVSTHAGVVGGLGALSKVKKARALLESAEKINGDAMHGSVYTSLGSLYYQVPGWPIGFGDNDKAEKYLKKALALNADGIDPNFFYGDFLYEKGNYKESVAYLQKAMHAPARAGRPVADKGRREEVKQRLHDAELKVAWGSDD